MCVKRRVHRCDDSLNAHFVAVCVISLLVLSPLSCVAAYLPSSFGTTLPPYRASTRPDNTVAMERVRKRNRGETSQRMVIGMEESIAGVLSTALLSALPAVSGGEWLASMSPETAEALAGPFFGLSLFPYLAFIYFLNVPANNCPKGVTVGFASCLLFVALTIPAAIVAKVWYGTSLANCDWLHGSAESMLTITNLATVLPFRRALAAKEHQSIDGGASSTQLPVSATSYAPTVWLVSGLTVVALITAIVPAISNPTIHTPYLNGVLDLPFHNDFLVGLGGFLVHAEPDNALTVATWIIHVSSLVEFLVVMGFCWRWADVVENPTWKGLTWGLIPLHTSGITACVSHVLYNQIAVLVPLQALLTCIGNTTAAYAAYRIARSNGWTPPSSDQPQLDTTAVTLAFTNESMQSTGSFEDEGTQSSDESSTSSLIGVEDLGLVRSSESSPSSFIGFEDLGQALANDNDVTFLLKLFVGCALFSYLIKYGELFFDIFFEASLPFGLALIVVPSALNAYKWNRRSNDPTFQGWF